MLNSAPVLTALTGDSRSAPDQTGFGPYSHACWCYATDAERARAACEWLADGLRQGYRAAYVADAPVDDLIAELADVPNRDEALRRGELVVFSMSDLYDLCAPIDAQAQLAVYAGAVEQALADCFRGLRVAADISTLVEDPARLSAHTHWEQLADRYISQHPLAPLCLYDTRRVADIEAIVGAHPMQGPTAAPFSLYAAQPHGAALTGEIDLAGHDALRDLLAGQPDSDRVIDTSELMFLDGRAAWLLHAHLVDRRVAGNPLVLSNPSDMLRRVWSVSGFDSGYLD
jgi:anti-anti-sigma regulatory factor